jgi:hypothetical protein
MFDARALCPIAAHGRVAHRGAGTEWGRWTRRDLFFWHLQTVYKTLKCDNFLVKRLFLILFVPLRSL